MDDRKGLPFCFFEREKFVIVFFFFFQLVVGFIGWNCEDFMWLWISNLDR